MIGFHGARQPIDLNDGRFQQRVTCRTPDDVAFWKSVYPDGHKFRAVFLNNDLVLNGNDPTRRLIFQAHEERMEWVKTFPQTAMFDHYARWESERVLVLGSEPSRSMEKSKEGKEPTIEDQIEELRQMSEKKLRSEAAKLGLKNIDPGEGKEMLLARVKKHLELPPKKDE